jgi:hypothetical protein
MRHGTWQETGGGGGSPAGLLALVALVIVGGGVAEGIAQAVASIVTVLLAVVGVVVVLVAGGVTVLAVSRTRHPDRPARMIPRPQYHQLQQEQERPAIEPPAARELHNHWHLHIGAGADPAEVAAVLRQVRRDSEP